MMGPEQVRAFASGPRAPEVVGVLVMALERSLDWRRIGTQRCGCGCGSFRAVFKHLPTDEFVGVEVACGEREGGATREVVGSSARMPRRWAAWAWER